MVLSPSSLTIAREPANIATLIDIQSRPSEPIPLQGMRFISLNFPRILALPAFLPLTLRRVLDFASEQLVDPHHHLRTISVHRPLASCNVNPADAMDYGQLCGQLARPSPEDCNVETVGDLSCRLAARAPLEAAEAYLNIRPYKERPGHVYTHLRPNWEILGANATDDDELDYVDLKVGQAHNLELRMENYEVDCVDEPILWAYSYQTSRPKLIERLTHLTLWAMDAKRVSYPCYGCNVRHREHFSEAKSGGLEVVAAIIEYWLGRIGERTYYHSIGVHDPRANLRVKRKSSRLGSPSGKVVQTNGLESSVRDLLDVIEPAAGGLAN
ncbi:hypothetical protein DFH06DRAFT_1139023 [Mycena polygramma]|nr:hypothetical protein DFH06DRAFT_1139023 [Mycena polygramma]